MRGQSYFGENQMVTDLLGGQLMVGLGGISSTVGHINAGKLRALAVTTPARLPQLPGVPALAETLPGFDASGWSGIVAPKQTPREIIDKLAAAVRGAQADPKFKERLNAVGVTELTMSSDDFSTFIAAETAKWAKVVKFAGLKPQ
jgi:tripartite-type tricarboxylate transporter receptor subunit TctC